MTSPPESAPPSRSERSLEAPLGGCSVDQFMRQYWQRRPLLIRQAFGRFVAPLDMAGVRELAGRDDVESRLVTAYGGAWKLQSGPFERSRIPSVKRREWTLLVQGVDRHDEAVHQLLRRFRFICDARLDDLMISIAGDGGGVGPHLDSYDVFLLQAHGRRRWRIGPVGAAGQSAPTLIDGLPLKILADFRPDQEWLLEPGDMLYLPPGWAHDGVAEGPCMTYSIGFRAPSRHEFLQAWLSDSADSPGGKDPRYRDPTMAATDTPAQIPSPMADRLASWAREWRPDERALQRFIGRYLTEPAHNVWFDPPDEVPSASRRPPATSDPAGDFAQRAAVSGLRLDRQTRAGYRGRDLFINGECFPQAAYPWLRRLADQRELSGRPLERALRHAASAELLRRWWSFGWLVWA